MRGTRKYKHIIDTPDPGKWELAGYEESLPISEKSNPITRELDKADVNTLVQLLRNCDAEIFQEEDETIINYQRLYSESILKTIMDIAKKVQQIIENPDEGLIVLSGCGTSGRLAVLLANSFNRLMRGLHQSPCYTYIIAGGDRSIVTARESTEDDPVRGQEELQKACEGKKKVVFIGISCSLSAPFIAGQLDFCMKNLDVFLPVLVGFNTVSMARNDRIEGWNFTFRQVAEQIQNIQDTQRAFVLNPAVGPEGLCGSSRMKGGSASKILLETLFLVAHKASSKVEVTEKCLLEILRTYERAHKVTYSHSKKIAALLKQSATSLQKSGHLYVIGWGTLGLVGIMDAVECVPSYNADWQDVRGFIYEGYRTLENKEGDLTPLISTKKMIPDPIVITWPILFLEYEGAFIQTFQRELSSKWVLDTVTAGAHVLKGKIYRNFIVDFTICNSKHFQRAVCVLQRLSGHPQSRCTEALLQSIYGEQTLTEQMRNAETSQHIRAAAARDKVLPVAIVSLLRNCSVVEARTRLESSESVRAAIESSHNVPGRKRGAESVETAGRSR
ncbi:glucokinase regulatory protein isoform 2-T3 [Anomaloglossus baeobatrachus]|uniref:glucokinase regulatory protein isoform X2 n=1 Tax=Anomaloglossus baeobatrachus TaxID=238106 RepID=UPI003F4F7191